MDSLALISILSDGKFHSGSELGDHFGVSRTAVWKALSHLEEYGLSIESVKGKGYRLEQAVDLVDPAVVIDALPGEVASILSFDAYPSVDSTNSLAADLIRDAETDFVCAYAEMQTAGRGRRGRSWYSPFAQNIYMSLAFRIQGGPNSIAGLSLVAGLSVRRAIMRCSSDVDDFKDLKLKWPNDVLLEGKKLAGLLVELQGEISDSWTVVVGLGLNFSMSVERVEDAIDQPWASLAGKISCSKSEFLSVLIECLVEDMLCFKRDGFSSFRQQWGEHDYFDGQEVVVLGSDIVGQSKGVDVSGNLLLESRDGIQAINAGEVSVRRKDS